MLYKLTRNFVNSLEENSTEVRPGKWVPARPLLADTLFERLKHAWGVLIGRYDAIEWPDQ